jgi:ERCC4-related helicase
MARVSSAPAQTIAPGAHIEVRDAVWRVIRIDPTSNGTAAWRCVGISEIVRDQEAVFLEELEPKVRVLDPRETKLVRDTSKQHRAGLLFMESLLREVPPPDDALYVGHRAAMDLLEFQLDPAWRALTKPRQRILIADAVGLGKTLEAGILLSELIRRGRAKRILVATTKAMLTQFQKEMWGRFSIPLVRLDSVGLQRIRAEIPTHHNPFYYYDRTIISIDTLKQNNWFRTHVEQAYWDVIVVDEAHNVALRGSGSQRARIADLLAQRCDSLVLLSATPHDGRARSFASLMNMLDPTAIADPDNYTKEDIKGLYVRRFKAEVADQLEKGIPTRRMSVAHATASAVEERAFETLTSLSFTRIDQRAHGGILFRTTLEKALFSSPAACLATIEARIKRLTVHKEAIAYETDIAALKRLGADVAEIAPDRFSKYQRLLEVLRKSWKWKPTKKDDRLVIFTERRETQRFLAERLTADLGLKKGQLATLSGEMGDAKQQEIVEAFGQEKAKLRLLVATDVAAEGLNLHYLCHRLIHFDVPWSLMLFQQRNGRVDRYGQEREPHLLYLLTDSANEQIKGDARILQLLIEKDAQAQKNISDPGAFMNVYDVEDEVAVTARAIEQRKSAEEFDKALEKNLKDPFALLLDGGLEEDKGDSASPIKELPSLFGSDFAYLEVALRRLQETTGIKTDVRSGDQLAEITVTDDLKRRFRKLPHEVRPADGVLLLTADPQRMKQAIDDSRREELAWPKHHYLWANSPVLSWVNDRMRTAFSRHEAPVLVAGETLEKDEVAIVVSGLLPNRRAQPVVHRWYVACFKQAALQRVEPFQSFLERAKLATTPLPNAGEEVDTVALQALLPEAIEAVTQKLAKDRDAFRACTDPRLAEELDRLGVLQKRQLEFAETLMGERQDTVATSKREAERRRIERIFRAHQRWVQDTMTIADQPFVQVIAALLQRADSVSAAIRGVVEDIVQPVRHGIAELNTQLNDRLESVDAKHDSEKLRDSPQWLCDLFFRKRTAARASFPPCQGTT